jgi:SAM-dependent methyltransferase
MHQLSDEQILHSWAVNAPQWTTAVREGLIESRPLVTNRAITGAVSECSPDSVIDLGCGEGWLVRQLGPWVRRLVGVDAIPALVDQARAAGGGEFINADYAEIEAGRLNESFNMAVFNFSLRGDDSVEGIFQAMPLLLKLSGRVIVQTLHPFFAGGDFQYSDGWRASGWDGFGPEFVDPAPWYFRTLANWHALFARHHLRLLEIREPLHPSTGRPSSMLFIGMLAEDRPCSMAPVEAKEPGSLDQKTAAGVSGSSWLDPWLG